MPILTVFYIKLIINLGLTLGIFWVISRSDLFAKWQQEKEKSIFAIGFHSSSSDSMDRNFSYRQRRSTRRYSVLSFIKPKRPKQAVLFTVISGLIMLRYMRTLSVYRFGSGIIHVPLFCLWF